MAEAVSRLEPDGLDPAHELALLLEAGGEDGAVVTFVGRTRSQQGATEALLLDHHPVLSAQSLDEIARAALERFEVSIVRVVHRCGRVVAGEPIVFAGASARHRRAAFDAADYLMDRLKTEAVLWKKEEGPEGARWIEPAEEDYEARRRWGE